MAAVAMEDKKKEMIEKTAQEFQKLNGDNQMFILGYMLVFSRNAREPHRSHRRHRRWQEWKYKEHSMPSASLTLWQ